MTKVPEGISHYEAKNHRTGEVRRYKTGPAASRMVDKWDNEHGSYISSRRAVYKDIKENPDKYS